MSLAEKHGFEDAVTTAKLNLAAVALDSGDELAAQVLFEEALERHSESGSREGVGFTLLNLGWAAFGLEDDDEAQQRFREAHDVFLSAGFPLRAAEGLLGISAVEHRRGRYLEAAQSLGRFQRILAEAGASPGDDYGFRRFGEIEAESKQALGEEAFESALEEGRAQA